MGQATTNVYILVVGKCDYYRNEEKKALGNTGKDIWISEAALWLKWKHRGTLHSGDRCSMVTFSISQFRMWVTEHAEMGLQASKFAGLVAKGIPTLETAFVLLDDLWNDLERMANIDFSDKVPTKKQRTPSRRLSLMNTSRLLT